MQAAGEAEKEGGPQHGLEPSGDHQGFIPEKAVLPDRPGDPRLPESGLKVPGFEDLASIETRIQDEFPVEACVAGTIKIERSGCVLGAMFDG